MPPPALSEIKWMNDWPDNSADYIISVVPFETNIELASTSLIFDESKLLELHIYVRSLSEDEPSEIGEIQKELERIFTENPTALKDQGIALIQALDFRQIFDSDNTKTLWHFVYDVQLFYRKFVIINEP